MKSYFFVISLLYYDCDKNTGYSIW
jgi:hypothetical protein